MTPHETIRTMTPTMKQHLRRFMDGEHEGWMISPCGGSSASTPASSGCYRRMGIECGIS